MQFMMKLLLVMLLNSPFQYASLEITYQGNKVLTHMISEHQRFQLIQKGTKYYASFLPLGNYQLYSGDEVITSFHINHNHLNKGMKFTLNEQSKKEVKDTMPLSFICYLTFSLFFFGILGWFWLKVFPYQESEWYNHSGDDL